MVCPLTRYIWTYLGPKNVHVLKSMGFYWGENFTPIFMELSDFTPKTGYFLGPPKVPVFGSQSLKLHGLRFHGGNLWENCLKKP